VRQRLERLKLVSKETQTGYKEYLVRGEFGNLYKVAKRTCSCPFSRELPFLLCKHLKFVEFVLGVEHWNDTVKETSSSIRILLGKIKDCKACFVCRGSINTPTFGNYFPPGQDHSNFCYNCKAAYCRLHIPLKLEKCAQCKEPFRGIISYEGYYNIYGLTRSEFPTRQYVDPPHVILKRYRMKKKLKRMYSIELRKQSGRLRDKVH